MFKLEGYKTDRNDAGHDLKCPRYLMKDTGGKGRGLLQVSGQPKLIAETFSQKTKQNKINRDKK